MPSEATDATGRVVFSAPSSSQTPGPVQQRYALLIGINAYHDASVPNLRYCVNDVRALARAFEEAGYVVVTLHSEAREPRLRPTRHNVEAELKRVCSVAQQDDLVLVHFAGHGALVEGEAHLLLEDTRADALAEQSLAVSAMRAALATSAARRRVLVLDACHAGVDLGRSTTQDEAFIRAAFEEAEGFALLAASTARQKALEWADFAQGVFSYYLLEGLRGAADRADKRFVTVGDLTTHIKVALRAWSLETGMPLQLPTEEASGANAAGIILADYRDAGAPPAASTPTDEFLRPLRPDAPSLTPGMSLGALPTRMLEDYEEIFGGRGDLLAELDVFLDRSRPRAALLVAPTGLGKTALLIHWARRVAESGAWRVVFAAISGRYETAAAEQILRPLARAVGRVYGRQIDSPGLDPAGLQRAIGDALREPPPDGRRLLLVVDGLDEAVGWEVGRALFPRDLPQTVRVVASARDVAGRGVEEWLEQVGWAPADTLVRRLPQLSRDEVRELVDAIGDPVRDGMDDAALLDELMTKSEGDPLTVKLLVRALQDGSLTPGELTHLPPGLETYLRYELRVLEEKVASDESELVYEVLGLLALAHGPLTTGDLQALTPLGRRVMRLRRVLDASSGVGRFVLGNGSDEAGYVFSYPRLKELYLERLLSPAERDEFRARFIAFGRAWWEARDGAPPGYLRQFWASHLAEAGEWALMRSVLTEMDTTPDGVRLAWATYRYATEGSYAGYLGDLTLLARRTDAAPDLSTLLRVALIRASILAAAAALPPELLVALVTTGGAAGRWTPLSAVEQVRLQSPDQALASLRALAAAGVDLPPDQTLEVVRERLDGPQRAEALRVLLPALDDPHRRRAAREALEIAAGMPPSLEWSRILVTLAPLLPQGVLDAARAHLDGPMAGRVIESLRPYVPLPLLRESRKIPHPHRRARALRALVPYLPTEQRGEILDEALAAAREIEEAWQRGHTLAYLAPVSEHHPDPGFLDALLEAVRSLPDDTERARALAGVTPHLPASRQTALWEETIGAARAQEEPLARAGVLLTVARHGSAPQPHALLEEVQTLLATSPDDEWQWAQLVEQLLPLAPRAAIDLVREMAEGSTRAKILVQAAPYSPRETLATAATLNERDRSAVLEALAPHDPEGVYEMARDLEQADYRARVLGALLPVLDGVTRQDAEREALEAARAHFHRPSRIVALVTLASHLTLDRRRRVIDEAFQMARHISDEREVGDLLVAIVPIRPEATLEVVAQLGSSSQRARLLRALAPYRPSDAWAATRELPADFNRALLCFVLATYLDEPERSEALAEATTLAGTLTDEWQQFELLEATAPVFPVETVELARSMERTSLRADLLATALPHLPVELRRAVAREALEDARGAPAGGARARTLIKLVSFLDRDAQPGLVEEIVATAHTLTDRWHQSDVWQRLAPLAPEEALRAARALPEAAERADRLIAIGEQLPDSRQAEVFEEALELTLSASEDGGHAERLVALAPHLPDRVLAVSRALSTDQERRPVLSALAAHRPRAVWEAARELGDPRERAQLLGTLVATPVEYHTTELVAATLEAAETTVTGRMLVEVISLLAPLAPEAALAAATRIEDAAGRAEAKMTVAPHLGPPAQVEVMRDALEDAGIGRVGDGWRAGLAALAETLPADRPDLLVAVLAHPRPRPEFLGDLFALGPWLARLEGADELIGELAGYLPLVARVRW